MHSNNNSININLNNTIQENNIDKENNIKKPLYHLIETKSSSYME